MAITILPFDEKKDDLITRGHRNDTPNGHVKSRWVWVEIIAKKGKQWLRFYGVRVNHCLDLARDLHEDGWQVGGISTYYTPLRGYNLYEEADQWFYGPDVKGFTNGEASLRDNYTDG